MIVKTENLRKIYGSGETEVRALDGVSLSVEEGEFVAVVGSSGSGKSTLLHLLGGLDRPTSGEVWIAGQSLFSMKDEALTIFRRRKIGFVFQAYNLVPVLSVYENVLLPVQLDGGTPDEGYLGQVIETLGLESRLGSLPSQLSGGQQQRVAIARALAAKPALLLAAGQLAGQAVQLALQAQRPDDLIYIAAVHFPAVQLDGQDDVLIDAEHGHQVIGLEYKADLPPAEDGQRLVLQGKQLLPVHCDRAGGGPVQAAQHMEQGRFAASGGAHNGHELPVLHAQVHPVQGPDLGFAGAIVFF